MSGLSLELREVCKNFGRSQIIRNASLQVPRGERVAIMRHANPALIPRNHLVEEAISAAVGNGDFLPFEILTTALLRPYADQPEFRRFEAPPRPDQVVHQTFCGT